MCAEKTRTMPPFTIFSQLYCDCLVDGETKMPGSMSSDGGRTQRIAPQVLIIEDNETDYLLLERQLKKYLAPSHIQRAAARDELPAALARPWDLIVTDYHLPAIEGRELLETIAAAQPATPCLLLSGSSEAALRDAPPANVVAVVEKGDHAALRAALANILNR